MICWSRAVEVREVWGGRHVGSGRSLVVGPGGGAGRCVASNFAVDQKAPADFPHPVPRAGPPAAYDGDGPTQREGGGDGEESGGEAAGVARSPPEDVLLIGNGTK